MMSPACTLPRRWFAVLLVGVFLNGNVMATGQELSNRGIPNGNFEEVAAEGRPPHWICISPNQGRFQVVREEATEGSQALLLDSTNAHGPPAERFTNAMQSIDAKPYRGKRVKFQAKVRTAELEGDAAAQLWLRVDLPSVEGEPQTGAFDNMQDRPISTEQWQPFSIELPVAEKAERLALGLFLKGQGKAWVDDVQLAIVGGSADENDANERPSEKKKSATPTRRAGGFQLPPLVQQAFQEAEAAPQQPFFTPWLGLAGLAMFLFWAAAWPPRLNPALPADAPGSTYLGPVSRFGLFFSVSYWVLYSFPAPFTKVIPFLTQTLATAYQQGTSFVVHGMARYGFGIEHELVPPNGSGDTTYNYIQVFVTFCLALGIATVWFLVDRRRSDYRLTRDLLQSYLRWVLALTMLSYGLAKVAWDRNQFPTVSELGELQLNKTWGDSSPMNVLWTFMGASRPYTVFAGLGEVVGGLLLIFRRTATLGALITAGVMANVMLLNYCYDVPVKLYSTHLFLMAVCILLPSLGALANIFWWHRPTQPVSLGPPLPRPYWYWGHRGLKYVAVILAVLVPLVTHAVRQVQHFQQVAARGPFYGEFEWSRPSASPADDEQPSSSADAGTLNLEQRGYDPQGNPVTTNWLVLVRDKKQKEAATFVVEGGPVAESGGYRLNISGNTGAELPRGAATLTPTETGGWRLSGENGTGSVSLDLRPATHLPRLTGRGYRWINEVPFNR